MIKRHWRGGIEKMPMKYVYRWAITYHCCTWWRHQIETCPRYWPFVRGIHRSSGNSPHKGQWPGTSPHKGRWRGALMFTLIYDWLNGWVNNWWFEMPVRLLWHHCNEVMCLELGLVLGSIVDIRGCRLKFGWRIIQMITLLIQFRTFHEERNRFKMWVMLLGFIFHWSLLPTAIRKTTIEIRAWINDSKTHKALYVITYPRPNLSYFLLVNGITRKLVLNARDLVLSLWEGQPQKTLDCWTLTSSNAFF